MVTYLRKALSIGLFPALVLLLLGGIAAAGQRSKVYENRQVGFAITPPTGWIQEVVPARKKLAHLKKVVGGKREAASEAGGE